jgi:hypothetical protein
VDKVGSLKVVEEVALDKVTAMDKVVVRVGNRDIRIIRLEALYSSRDDDAGINLLAHCY